MENCSDSSDGSELSYDLEGFSDESGPASDSDKEDELKGFSDESGSASDSDEEDTCNYYHTEYGMYPRDESDSYLVQAVKSGNLHEVKSLLDDFPPSSPEQVLRVNEARKWTEVQEKMGYDKSWTWFGDTALIAAARLGNLEMIRILLLAGADPTLESCPIDDEYENPLKAANTRKEKYEQELKKIEDGSLSLNGSDLEMDAGKRVESLLNCVSKLTKVVDLLKIVEGFWIKTSYSSAHFTKDRIKAFSSNPNQPKDVEALRKTLENFDFGKQEICMGKLATLTEKFSAIQEKKKVSRVPKYRIIPQHPIIEAPLNNNACQGIICYSLPAKNCCHSSCSECCPGKCPRHSSVKIF